MTRGYWAVFVAFAASGCALAAGLGDFQRADGGSGTGAEAGSAGEGGRGGADEGGGGAGGEGGESICNADHLVISEARTNGSNQGSDDLVEIFNPTPEPVSLAGYTLSARAPTSNETERFSGTGDMILSIPAYGHLLIAGAGFDDGPSPDKQLESFQSFGDDVLIFLNKDGVRVDVLCICADPPCDGPDWDECGGVVLPNPSIEDVDQSVHREPACVDTDAAVDFVPGASSPMNLASAPTPP